MTPWTVAHQAPLSMGLPRQEYWSGLSFPFPGDLPTPGSNVGLLHWQADALPSETSGEPICVCVFSYVYVCIQNFFSEPLESIS